MSTTVRMLAIGITILSLLQFSFTKTARAQGPGAVLPGSAGFTLAFDEQGNSLFNGGPNFNLVVPLAGGGINFFLPVQVVPGYVLATDPIDISTTNPTGESDLLVFFNTTLASGQTVGVMNYGSLIDDNSPPDLADVTNFSFPQPITTITESGLEGNNAFTWIPDPPNAAGAVYIGISDGVVPEPSSVVLGSLGMVSLFVMGWWHRRGGAHLQNQIWLNNAKPAVCKLQ